MNTEWMRGLAIATGMAGLLALTTGVGSAQASSGYGGGYRYGPMSTQSQCLTLLAEVEQSPYVTSGNCQYLTYSPITGQNPDPGWYLWDFVQNPNL